MSVGGHNCTQSVQAGRAYHLIQKLTLSWIYLLVSSKSHLKNLFLYLSNAVLYPIYLTRVVAKSKLSCGYLKCFEGQQTAML